MRASKDELSAMLEAGAAAVHGADWGGMRSMIMTLPAGTDITPLLRGLPGDRCPCPHWGYVVSGRLRVIYADHEETLRAGDVWYMPPGHTAVVEEDLELIELAPSDEHQTVLDVVQRNLATQPAGSA